MAFAEPNGSALAFTVLHDRSFMRVPPPSAPSITSITPDVAIEWGFNLYLADCTPGYSEANRAARRALEEFEDVAEAFAEQPQERLYLVKLRMAATSFARGIGRRKETLATRLSAAVERKRRCVAKIAQTERMGGIARGALQLLMLGGFSYVVTRLILEIPGLGLDRDQVDPRYASFAMALGSALIGSFIKAWWMGRRILAVFQEYDLEVREAEREYTVSVIKEYELAAQVSYNAWSCLTGEAPPVTPAFRNLLMSVMGRPLSRWIRWRCRVAAESERGNTAGPPGSGPGRRRIPWLGASGLQGLGEAVALVVEVPIARWIW